MKSDNFAGRPYGFTTNQISHAAAVGFIGFVYLGALFWYHLAGEYPPKLSIVAVAAIGYLAFELVSQGWQGWDTLEDWWFVNVYGVWAPLTAFSELEQGSAAIIVDPYAPLPFVILLFTHLLLGAAYRAIQSRGSEY